MLPHDADFGFRSVAPRLFGVSSHKLTFPRCSIFVATPCSDQNAESALNFARSTIPAASRVPILPIPALVELTRRDITENDLMEYADHKSKHHMAGHCVFVLFPPGSEKP